MSDLDYNYLWRARGYARCVRGQPSDEVVQIFLHIPKTAGLTVNTVLTQVYEGQRVYPIYGPRWEQSVDLFRGLPQFAKNKFKAVYGHQYFGLHKEFTKPTAYFSLLREPIARLVSLYRYSRSDPTMRRFLGNDLSMENIFDGVAISGDNTMTRFLAGGATKDIVPTGQCSEMLFDVAAEHLERWIVPGIVEQFDRSLSFFAEILGWPELPPSKTVNVSKEGNADAIRQEVISRFPEYYAFDQRLYDLACAKFERETAARGL